MWNVLSLLTRWTLCTYQVHAERKQGNRRSSSDSLSIVVIRKKILSVHYQYEHCSSHFSYSPDLHDLLRWWTEGRYSNFVFLFILARPGFPGVLIAVKILPFFMKINISVQTAKGAESQVRFNVGNGEDRRSEDQCSTRQEYQQSRDGERGWLHILEC